MADIGDICAFCQDEERNCIMCSLGNPCLGCEDYTEINHVYVCMSNGGCALERRTDGKDKV